MKFKISLSGVALGAAILVFMGTLAHSANRNIAYARESKTLAVSCQGYSGVFEVQEHDLIYSSNGTLTFHANGKRYITSNFTVVEDD